MAMMADMVWCMVVEGDWPGRMPKKAVVEKTKDQLSAQKVPARLIFLASDLGLTPCEILLLSRLHLPNL
jgi:hypothetical protein